MIILVKELNQVKSGQYTNLEVKGINTKTQKETTQTIYSTLSDKWGLIEKDKMVELVMQNKGTGSSPRWQVTDIKLAPIAEANEPERETSKKTRDDSRSAEIERNVWWKELGEWIRIKETPDESPYWKALRTVYFAKMFEVLNIKTEKRED